MVPLVLYRSVRAALDTDVLVGVFVKSMTQAALGVQLWMHINADPPAPERVQPIRNTPTGKRDQPDGGIWTATWDPAIGSTYVAALGQIIPRHRGAMEAIRTWRMQLQMHRITEKAIGSTFYRNGWFHYGAWHLTPAPTARVLPLATEADFQALFQTYDVTTPGRLPYLDFERMSQQWDALHLTAQGAPRAQSLWRYYNRFFEWEIECTLWFRWCFTTVSERMWVPVFA
jgi:hypothetical protein